eukprot:12526907-Alexandrium_andersonii.AAC.1
MSIESRLTQRCIWRSPALGTLFCGPEIEHRETTWRSAVFGDHPLSARSLAARRMSLENRLMRCCIWRSL